jgi:hypothetical protein
VARVACELRHDRSAGVGARQTTDRQIAERLVELAREFDEQAAEIEKTAERNSS